MPPNPQKTEYKTSGLQQPHMWYTIKKFASLFGLTPKTLRHYDKIGLLKPSGKSESGYRLYADEDIERLRRILLLKQLRIPLKQIGGIIDCPSKDLADVLRTQLFSLNDWAAQSTNLAGIAGKMLHDLSPSGSSDAASGCGTGDDVRAAALAIGLQNDFFSGALRCDRAFGIIEPLQRLLLYMRKVKIPIFYVCDAHFEGQPMEDPIWGPHALIGTAGAEIIPQLPPGKGDIVVHKHHYSAFFQTELLGLLKKHSINMLLLSGVHTHLCVRQTAEEARTMGFRVMIATDCTTAFTHEDHEAALRFLKDGYSVELTTGERIILDAVFE